MKNPLEQHSCRINENYKKRIKYHLKSGLMVFEELINLESDHLKLFLLVPRVNRLLRGTDALIVKKILVDEGEGNFQI